MRQPIPSRRPSGFSLVIWFLLLALSSVAVLGIDLHFMFLSLVWPVFADFSKHDSFVHWIEPSRTIVQAPLIQPVFGWPACLICLTVFGVRRRYRRPGPVSAVVLISLFGMYACVLIYELGVLSLGIHIRRHWIAGDWQRVVAALGCNVVIACVVWRWTRSRLMLVGLIALAMLGPVQYAVGRCSHYFHRFKTMQTHGGGPSQTIPSAFDKWIGPDLMDSWFNRSMHAMFDGDIVQKTVSFPIAYETYIDDQPGVATLKRLPGSYLYINVPFGMTYNAGVLALACVATLRSRRSEELRCSGCGYELKGLPVISPCPECGQPRPSRSTKRSPPV